jgi:hypothetical protein
MPGDAARPLPSEYCKLGINALHRFDGVEYGVRAAAAGDPSDVVGGSLVAEDGVISADRACQPELGLGAVHRDDGGGAERARGRLVPAPSLPTDRSAAWWEVGPASVSATACTGSRPSGGTRWRSWSKSR